MLQMFQPLKKKKEALTQATIWTNFENMTLGKRSQIQKAIILYMIPFI